MKDEGQLVDPKDAGSLADQAVLYVLRRMRVDANLRWYMLGTEAFARLCHAHAEITGKSIEQVEEMYSEPMAHCAGEAADVERLGPKLQKIRQALRDFGQGAPTLVDRIVTIMEERS